jgi:hypothetical protein
MQRVFTIVLNWNGKSDTLTCIESLQKQTHPTTVICVDNGSGDDSAAAIRARFPAITLIETGANLGYAGGNNVGIRHALASDADFIFVLNNDITLEPNCIEVLVNECAAHPEIDAAAPKSVFSNEPHIIYFAGGHISADGHTHHIGYGDVNKPEYDVASPTEWITGCALFVRRETFERVGLFDERFFLLFEDSDWSLHARHAGCQLHYLPAARVRHAGSASFGGKRSPLYQYYRTRNSLLWIERHFTFPKCIYLGARMIADSWRRSNRLSDPGPERARMRSATVAGVRDYAMRRFGCGPPGPSFSQLS